MQVLKSIEPSTATGKTKELFSAIEQRLKRIPNMIRLMANSPAILSAYLRFNEAFEETRLKPQVRGLITVAVSEINGCDYTLSTAFALGRHEGLNEDELTAARRAEAKDVKTAAALRFAAKTVQERGHVPAWEVEGLRNAGFTDEEIVEIIAAVALNVFRNYFNLIAATELDFPLVRTRRTTGHGSDAVLKTTDHG
jgi:uncharacterized peroxidase-related enzyme